jgi:hypothetical protein
LSTCPTGSEELTLFMAKLSFGNNEARMPQGFIGFSASRRVFLNENVFPDY